MYFADYCCVEHEPKWGKSWRICYMDSKLGCDCALLCDDDIDLKFGRKVDCELACKSLNEAESEGEDISEMSDERFRFLITRYLQW